MFSLLLVIGMYSTFKISKEIFPRFELDIITISGGYSGASIDMIDLSIASSIEDKIKNINGIKELSSSITSGRFLIRADLKKNADKDRVLEDIKDGVNLAKPTFPSDMNDPIIKVAIVTKTLASVAITSEVLSPEGLVEASKKLQEKLFAIKGVAEANIVGGSEFFYEINIDEKKIEALDVSHNSLFSAISKMSYIFPVGKIEDTKQVYISTANGKKNLEDFANTLIHVQNKTFRLLDVAEVKKRHSDKSKLFTYNLRPSLSIDIKQSENANAMTIVQEIEKTISKNNNENINYELYDDRSIIITQRLNMVTSSIALGIILLFVAMSLLINIRMAIIITLGIPVAFLFTIIYFYIFDFSINLISLIGLLIATGIIVDDAIVISENIQRYIEEGKSPTQSAIDGVSELIKPITIASITTVFAFLPSLMISGTMGKFIQLIPIAVSMTILASLLEVFLFLPLHSKHILSSKSKSLSWDKANTIYLQFMRFLFSKKKLFLIFVIFITPIIMFLMLKQTSFQLFPKFDSSNINISIKANKNMKLEESFEIMREIEKDIMKNKEQWGISSINSITGFRITNSRSVKQSPNSIYIKINLHDLIPDDFVNLYIIPSLNIFETNRERKRNISSRELSKIVKKYIEERDYKNKYNLEYIDIVQNRAGPVRSDIQIGLSSNDNAKMLKALNDLNTKMENDELIRSSFISASKGIDELKISLNSYGESLGLTEADIGKFLSNYYLAKKVNLVFEKDDILDVRIQSMSKNNLESLKYQNIPLNDGKMVNLKDVVSFTTIQSFEEIIKTKGERIFYLYANVHSDKSTASEVLAKYKEDLEEIKKEGIKVTLKGEQEKNQELARDMKFAVLIAFTLILISMLYMFNSFKQTFIVLSVIPFSLLGVIAGHLIIGVKLSMLSAIGVLGLSGVVINDGIIMMEFIKRATNIEEVFYQAKLRLRPILLTSITTLIGFSILIFFPYGQAILFQPLTISLGFGLFWGTLLNITYLPILYVVVSKKFQ